MRRSSASRSSNSRVRAISSPGMDRHFLHAPPPPTDLPIARRARIQQFDYAGQHVAVTGQPLASLRLFGVLIVWRHGASKEVLWFANGNLRKSFTVKLQPQELTPARVASSIVWLDCACQGCPKAGKALRAGGRFAAPPLTVLVEPGTWRLGSCAGISGRGFSAAMFLWPQAGSPVAAPMNRA